MVTEHIRYFNISKEDMEYDNWEEYWQEVLAQRNIELEKEIEAEANQPEETDARTFRNETGLTISEMLLDDERYVPYLNHGKRSGVNAYALGPNYILVRFNDGGVYLYTDKLLTEAEIANLKQLAEYGSGLNSYLTRLIGTRYTARYYKNIVFIKPGLEAIDYTLSLEHSVPIDGTDTLREKMLIKHLQQKVETNHGIRQKRLCVALGRSVDELYKPLTRNYIRRLRDTTAHLTDDSPAVRTLFVTPRDKFSYIPELLVDSNEKSIYDASVFMLSTFFNTELIKLINISSNDSTALNLFKEFNKLLSDQFKEVRLPGEYHLTFKTPPGCFVLDKLEPFLWNDKLLDDITNTNVETAIAYVNTYLNSFSTQHDKLNKSLIGLCNMSLRTLTFVNCHETATRLVDLLQLTDDINNYLTDLLIANLYLISKAE